MAAFSVVVASAFVVVVPSESFSALCWRTTIHHAGGREMQSNTCHLREKSGEANGDGHPQTARRFQQDGESICRFGLKPSGVRFRTVKARSKWSCSRQPWTETRPSFRDGTSQDLFRE